MLKNLKYLRQCEKISQQQLADNIMVSQQSVNKYENHNIEPDIDTLIKIADYFNVSLDYLVGRTAKEEICNNFDLNTAEMSMMKNFRKLSAEQKMCIMNLIDSYK